MSEFKRNGYRWRVNEILSLQREYELLGMSIDEIAEKHNRTPNAIMFKLDQEGFADYNELYSKYYNSNQDNNLNLQSISSYNEECIEEEKHDEITNLSFRVDILENSISEIKEMLQKLMNSNSNTKNVSRFF